MNQIKKSLLVFFVSDAVLCIFIILQKRILNLISQTGTPGSERLVIDKTKEIINNVADWRLKDSNLSANVGLGLMLLNHLQVSANYNIALGTTGEVDVNSALGTTWDTAIGKAKANAWQISVAYYF